MTHIPIIDTLTRQVLDGTPLSLEQGLELAALGTEHTTALLYAANILTRAYGHTRFSCSITNAKSGRCSQNCAFCAQSAHFSTNSPTYPLLPVAELIEQGLAMHRAGAGCYSLVTSGLSVCAEEIDHLCACLTALRDSTSLTLSASLGVLHDEAADRLVRAGLQRYHHNLETARSHFSSICSTHAYDDDIATLRLAKKHGLKLCSGGILGLGESFAQRIELAATLAEEKVESVPLNFLNPIPGTPLEHAPLLCVHDALKSVALFRFMLPRADITIAGGRERVLGEYQSWLPLAGANGLMIGNYLTTRGRDIRQDLLMMEQGQWI